jgi:hypothetical protein
VEDYERPMLELCRSREFSTDRLAGLMSNERF